MNIREPEPPEEPAQGARAGVIVTQGAAAEIAGLGICTLDGAMRDPKTESLGKKKIGSNRLKLHVVSLATSIAIDVSKSVLAG
jgi:hypothetical protein